MPFRLSRIHSSLTCQGSLDSVGTRQIYKSRVCLPRIKSWNLILLWWLSLYAHLLQVRSLTISFVQCVLSYTMWSVHNPGAAIVFACSYHTSLAREIISSGQIPFQSGSSQQSGRLTPLKVTQFIRGLVGISAHKVIAKEHLVRLERFLRLPIGTMRPPLPAFTSVICQGFPRRFTVLVPFSGPNHRWPLPFWAFKICVLFAPSLFLIL